MSSIAPGRLTISEFRRRNVWYTIRDGNWNDPSIWRSNGRRKPTSPVLLPGDVYLRGTTKIPVDRNFKMFDIFDETFANVSMSISTYFQSRYPYIYYEGCPQVGDIVYVNHNVTLSQTNFGNPTAIVLSELHINPNCTLTLSNLASNIWAVNNFQCRGTISMLSSAFIVVSNLISVDNSINQFNIKYAGNSYQDVISNITYTNLFIQGTGEKKADGNITVSGNLSIGGNFAEGTYMSQNLGTNPTVPWLRLELGDYNLQVNGTTSISQGGLSKSGPGNILFIGQLSCTANFSLLNFTGNPTVECRGGCAFSGASGGLYTNLPYTTGTGVWSFTTNNQSFNVSANWQPFENPFQIAAGITVTATGGGRWQINNDIEGVDGTSVLDNRGYIGYAGVEAMQTGELRCNIASNTFEYNGTNQNIKDISYWNLRITQRSENLAGSIGTKTAVNHVSCVGTLVVNGGSTNILQMSTYNLSVTGTSLVTGNARLNKNGAGALLFVGKLTVDNAFFDWSGNPTIETRNGYDGINVSGANCNTGTGSWSFTTNNQTIAGVNNSTLIKGNVSIVGNITVTFSGTGIGFEGTINGTTASSKLENRGRIDFATSIAAGAAMTTGILDITTFANTVGFNGAYSATIPYTTFHSLLVSGASGTKTLSGNTTLNGNLTTGGTGTFECDVYNLTVNGTALVAALTFSKTGAGNLLFVGLLTVDNASMILSGNPSVECRGGFTQTTNPFSTNYHSSAWSFTTNNQNLNLSTSIVLTQSITISGITLTIPTTSNSIISGLVDGTNGSSILNVLGTFNYRNATQPMATGLLYANQNTTNTCRYSASGNQDIKVPNDPVNPGYRNLVLEGSGAKRLLGNVSVKGTYTLTAPATLDNNGFALTNP